MVSNVSRQYRPRLGLQAPLRERWEDARARLERVAPDHHPSRSALMLQMGEYEIDCIEDAIVQVEKDKAPPPPSPEIQASNTELSALRARYTAGWLGVQAAQQKLRWAAGSWKHELLADIDGKAFVVPQQLGDFPEFRSVAEARMGVRNFLPTVLEIEERQRRLESALAFDRAPKDHQAIDLIEALYRRLVALEQRKERK